MQLIRNDKNILKFELTANFDATGYSAKLTIKNKSTNAVYFTDTQALSLDSGKYICLFDAVTFTTSGDYVYDVEVAYLTTYKKTPINNATIQVSSDVNAS